MSRGNLRLLALVFLAGVFTLALTFATIEAPGLVSRVLSASFPDLGLEFDLIEELIRNVRPIGYACLVLVAALIAAGCVTERRALSSLGSVALFLPTFGYFAFSMFFLAGIGILRVLWIPFWDSSPSFLKLGDIAYLPYAALAYPFRFAGIDVRTPLALLTIGLGLLAFFLGTMTWFYGKLERREVIDFWIYKYSRHPQYLGYILWSYGVMLLATFSPFPRGGYNPGPSFPWLISTLIIVCVALKEETDMIKRDERYPKYRVSAPFMLPLPKFVSSGVTAPVRILCGRNLPEKGKEIMYVFAVYCVILIALSLPFLLLDWPSGYGWAAWP